MLTLYDDDDNPIELPTRWEVCDHCQGEGKTSAHLGAFTSSELWEDFEFAEAYLRGDYDRRCPECQGRTTVKVVDFDRMSPELQARYEEAANNEAEYRQQCEMERRMGA